MSFTVWSSARFTFPLPEGHRFPLAKYGLLRERIVEAGIVPAELVLEPAAVTLEHLLLAHTVDYIERFSDGRLTAAEQRILGFPWSAELVVRSRRAAGGTLAAARHALTHGIGMNLAGGTHHAFAGHGEGFCVFNDVAIAIRVLQAEGRLQRAAIVDLDVHQGNGTHAIFAGDENVFTFSMHGGRNYPFHKLNGTLDIELDDGCDDATYNAQLESVLPRVLRDAAPDIVFFIAGADPHEGDALGRLRLTFSGLAARDSYVIHQCREVGIPVVVVIGGGYGRDIDDTVKVHLQTAAIASQFSLSCYSSSDAANSATAR